MPAVKKQTKPRRRTVRRRRRPVLYQRQSQKVVAAPAPAPLVVAGGGGSSSSSSATGGQGFAVPYQLMSALDNSRQQPSVVINNRASGGQSSSRGGNSSSRGGNSNSRGGDSGGGYPPWYGGGPGDYPPWNGGSGFRPPEGPGGFTATFDPPPSGGDVQFTGSQPPPPQPPQPPTAPALPAGAERQQLAGLSTNTPGSAPMDTTGDYFNPPPPPPPDAGAVKAVTPDMISDLADQHKRTYEEFLRFSRQSQAEIAQQLSADFDARLQPVLQGLQNVAALAEQRGVGDRITAIETSIRKTQNIVKTRNVDLDALLRDLANKVSSFEQALHDKRATKAELKRVADAATQTKPPRTVQDSSTDTNDLPQPAKVPSGSNRVQFVDADNTGGAALPPPVQVQAVRQHTEQTRRDGYLNLPEHPTRQQLDLAVLTAAQSGLVKLDLGAPGPSRKNKRKDRDPEAVPVERPTKEQKTLFTPAKQFPFAPMDFSKDTTVPQQPTGDLRFDNVSFAGKYQRQPQVRVPVGTYFDTSPDFATLKPDLQRFTKDVDPTQFVKEPPQQVDFPMFE